MRSDHPRRLRLREAAILLGLSEEEVISGVAAGTLPDPENTDPAPEKWIWKRGTLYEALRRDGLTCGLHQAARMCRCDAAAFLRLQLTSFMRCPGPVSQDVPFEQRQWRRKALGAWERESLRQAGVLLKLWFQSAPGN